MRYPRHARTSKLCLSLAVAGAVSFVGSAAVASGLPSPPNRVSIHWGSPDGPMHRGWTGPGPVDVFVVLRGQTEPLIGHRIGVRIASDLPCCHRPPNLRPAWRFDPQGCQANRLCVEHRPFLRFIDGLPGEQHLEFFDLSGDSTFVDILIAEVNLPAVQLDPDSAYVLLRLRFDHSHSVEGNVVGGDQCGGVGDQAVVTLARTSWLTTENVEVQWSWGQESAWWEYPGTARTEPRRLQCQCFAELPPLAMEDFRSVDDGIPQCDVPVSTRSATTWGRLKSGYR